MPDYNLTPLVQPQFINIASAALTFAPTGVVAVPANTVYRILTARVVNVGAVPVALTIWRVPNGAAADAQHTMTPVTVIVPVANNTFPHFDLTVLWGATLSAGDAIWAQAGAANALVIVADGAAIV